MLRQISYYITFVRVLGCNLVQIPLICKFATGLQRSTPIYATCFDLVKNHDAPYIALVLVVRFFRWAFEHTASCVG